MRHGKESRTNPAPLYVIQRSWNPVFFSRFIKAGFRWHDNKVIDRVALEPSLTPFSGQERPQQSLTSKISKTR